MNFTQFDACADLSTASAKPIAEVSEPVAVLLAALCLAWIIAIPACAAVTAALMGWL